MTRRTRARTRSQGGGRDGQDVSDGDLKIGHVTAGLLLERVLWDKRPLQKGFIGPVLLCGRKEVFAHWKVFTGPFLFLDKGFFLYPGREMPWGSKEVACCSPFRNGATVSTVTGPSA